MEARILLVEDDPSIREITQIGLAQAGFEVDTARDGDEALVRFRHDPPDLVVLDVMLPRRDGLEVCRAIRSDSAVPVVMLTATCRHDRRGGGARVRCRRLRDQAFRDA